MAADGQEREEGLMAMEVAGIERGSYEIKERSSLSGRLIKNGKDADNQLAFCLV